MESSAQACNKTEQSYVPRQEYAVVYVPARSRSRFSVSCVTVFGSAQQALLNADPAAKQFAAKVNGPSKSSEGQCIYYLMEWLADKP